MVSKTTLLSKVDTPPYCILIILKIVSEKVTVSFYLGREPKSIIRNIALYSKRGSAEYNIKRSMK